MTRSAVAALAIVLALSGTACKKRQKAAVKDDVVEKMSTDEVKRSEDACNAYVERVCTCAKTVPAATDACAKAQAQPEAVKLALEVAASPDSKPIVVKQSLDGVRKIVKECIEQTAKLPSLGCP